MKHKIQHLEEFAGYEYRISTTSKYGFLGKLSMIVRTRSPYRHSKLKDFRFYRRLMVAKINDVDTLFNYVKQQIKNWLNG
jgi:hypothetical protein